MTATMTVTKDGKSRFVTLTEAGCERKEGYRQDLLRQAVGRDRHLESKRLLSGGSFIMATKGGMIMRYVR